MEFKNRNKLKNQFVCPSDRQLALRAKLQAGWSSTKASEPLRPDEQAAIMSVIRRNEEIETAERQRVGRLVDRVEKMKERSITNRDPNCCRLCGDTFGLLRPSRIICEDCKQPVCSKCSLDIKISYHTIDRTKDVWLCRICSETREMWKKTGAWFFKGLPSYEIPTSASSTPSHLIYSSSRRNRGNEDGTTEIIPVNGIQSCNTTPIRNVHIRKLSIHVNDSSSSSADEGEERLDQLQQTMLVDSKEMYDNQSQISAQSPDSFGVKPFASIKSVIDCRNAVLPNDLFVNRQSSNSKLKNNYSQRDNVEIMPTSFMDTRRESTYTCRSSISSCWSLSDTSSRNSATLSTKASTTNVSNRIGINSFGTQNFNYRDPLLGWLEVSIIYRESYHCLNCTMVRARDLPAMDVNGLTDPYCKLNIIKEDGHTKYMCWQRSKTVHKTRNPEFNETIQFVGIKPDELPYFYLYVAIFDDDKFGHDFIGGAKIQLSTVQESIQCRICVPLDPEDKYSNEAETSNECEYGKMLLALCYNTKKRVLIVNVKQCINLIPMDNNGSSDPFVKLQLKPDIHKNKKFKTAIKWHSLNPIFNEEFHFETSPHDLNKQMLFLTVWDKDLGKSNDFLGSLVLGYNSKGERLQHWLDCIRIPDHFHEKWHNLSGENTNHH